MPAIQDELAVEVDAALLALPAPEPIHVVREHATADLVEPGKATLALPGLSRPGADPNRRDKRDSHSREPASKHAPVIGPPSPKVETA